MHTAELRGAAPRLDVTTEEYVHYLENSCDSLLQCPLQTSLLAHTDVALPLRTTLVSGLGRSLLKNFKQMCSMASPTSLLTALNYVNVTLDGTVAHSTSS